MINEKLQELQMYIERAKDSVNNLSARLQTAAEEIRSGSTGEIFSEVRRVREILNRFGGIDRLNEARRIAGEYEATQSRIFSEINYDQYFEQIKATELKPCEVNITVEIYNCSCDEPNDK